MLGKDALLGAIISAVSGSPAGQTEVRAAGGSSFLTRYGDNYIHQNVGETGYDVSVRAINQKRIGSSSTNQLDEETLSKSVRAANDLSGLVPETPDFLSLPGPGGDSARDRVPEGAYVETTATCPPDLRAAYVERAIAMAKDKGVKVAGSLSTEATEMAVANSVGVRAYTMQTRASLTCVAMSDDSSGYAEAFSPDVAKIDPTRVAEAAIEKCLASRNPISVPPGEYEVILEPGAVSSMLLYLAFLGMSAEAYTEGRSFMSGRMGERVAGDNVTIWDDGQDPDGFPVPFDFEGVPKQKVTLIDRGIAAGVVYNSLSAAKAGRDSTGHAVSQMGFSGSMPINLFMAGGDSSLEDMIASTRRGILVTRFHYVNPVHPVKTVITGMTRDGTFLIENGNIARGVKNLRFTESILGAFSRIGALSKERKVSGGYLTVVCPAIKVSGFAFTGATEF